MQPWASPNYYILNSIYVIFNFIFKYRNVVLTFYNQLNFILYKKNLELYYFYI